MRKHACYWTTGEDLTRTARDLWQEREDELGLELLQKTCIGMTREQAGSIVTGSAKLIGDSRKKGAGGLSLAPDQTTSHSGMRLLTPEEKQQQAKHQLAKARLRITCLQQLMNNEVEKLPSQWGLVRVPRALLASHHGRTGDHWTLKHTMTWENFAVEFPGLVRDAVDELDRKSRSASALFPSPARVNASNGITTTRDPDGRIRMSHPNPEVNRQLQMRLAEEALPQQYRDLAVRNGGFEQFARARLGDNTVDLLYGKRLKLKKTAQPTRTRKPPTPSILWGDRDLPQPDTPLPDRNLECTNGWIRPDGVFFGCAPYRHLDLADALGLKTDLVENTWVKVQDSRVQAVQGLGDFPLLPFRGVTQSQLNTMDRWCAKHRRTMPTKVELR